MALFDKIRGTMSSIFQIGKGGPNLKNSSGVIQNRNNADSAFATNEAGTFKLTNAAGQSIFISLPASGVTPWNAIFPTTEGVSGQVFSAAGSGTGFIWQDFNYIAHINNLRLGTQSGIKVSLSDQTAKSTIYLTPYNGHQISLYDGTRWRVYSTAEVSLALTGLTSGSNYDVFAYNNAGVVTLELTAWTNDTTRATALTAQDGVYVRTGAATRRYVGTIRTTGTNTTEDSSVNRFVYNYYNRVNRSLASTATSFHSYTTANFRAWNNGTGTPKINFVIGVAEDSITYGTNYCQQTEGYVGAALDGITPINETTVAILGGGVTLRAGSLASTYPTVGYHYIQAAEYGSATASFTAAGVSANINM